MIDWRFVGGLAVLMAAVAAGAWQWVDRLDGGQAGLLAGLGFSFVSLVVGFHWIRWSVTRGHTKFMTVALLTIVAAHFVFGAAEIVYLNRTGNLG